LNNEHGTGNFEGIVARQNFNGHRSYGEYHKSPVGDVLSEVEIGEISVANEIERHIERRRCGILGKGSTCNQKPIE